MRKLFHIISNGKAQNDEEAARIIYKSSGKEKKYLMLKRNLIKTLSEIVFKTNTFDDTALSYQKFRFLGKKELLIAEKLLNENVYHNAEKIVVKVKTYAENFFITELQIDCLEYLRTIYTLKGYPKEVEYYNIILKKLNKYYLYEQESMGFIYLLESKTKFSIGKYPEIAEEAGQFSQQIQEWQTESKSPALKLYQYKIDLIRCYHINDTHKWLFVLTRLTELIDAFPFLRSESLSLYINLEWGKYFRCIANLSEAAKFIDKALSQSDYAAFNKFEVQALNFDIKVKEENYEEAGKIFAEVKKCRQFHLLDPQDQAAWFLREAYLYFIFSAINNKPGLETYFSKFYSGLSVSALVNSCKAISKDKKGYNFMLVILKEALMKYKYPDDAESGGNNILVYYQRYMKDSCEERSKKFMKKFAKSIRLNFSAGNHKLPPASVKEKSAPEKYDAAELIPYEHFYKWHIFKSGGTLAPNKHNSSTKDISLAFNFIPKVK